MSFLDTAAQNYKYSFQEQVLIHAQKPSATACAEIGTWNQLGRWVNKGTKGIALLVDRDIPYKLRYVFDVSDTNSRAGREITLWKMERRYETAVMEALEDSFGEVEFKPDFSAFAAQIAEFVVENNLSDYLTQLMGVKGGSLLEELDDLNTEVWLKNMVNEKSTENVWWTCTECGNEWKSVVKARVKGRRCPVCAERKVKAGLTISHTAKLTVEKVTIS